LESAVGTRGGLILSIRAFVIVVRIVMGYRLNFVEEVMHPVRRRVGEKKQKRRSAKSA